MEALGGVGEYNFGPYKENLFSSQLSEVNGIFHSINRSRYIFVWISISETRYMWRGNRTCAKDQLRNETGLLFWFKTDVYLPL